ncbi:MAG: cytochrome c3 family protein [Anaerosomatales bacterium]|nr:cytochrome c3 family protein [Anaerosomatales bacterium]
MTGYRVWRALLPDGPYESIGTTVAVPSPSLSDVLGIPAQTYYYKVSAYDAVGNESVLSEASAGVYSSWTTNPHQQPTGSTRYCSWCHVPHVAAADNLLRDTGGTPVGQYVVCYNCHDGRSSGSNVADGPTDSFGLSSGHTLEWALPSTISSPPVAGELTNDCAGCHSVHSDSTLNAKLPKKMIVTVNGSVEPTTTDNSWCEACHNDSDDWYGVGYPAVPTRDATGYPVLGTFPGPTIYGDPAKNAHDLIPPSGTAVNRPVGSCLYCHAAHGGPNGYDGLRDTFRPTTTATVLTDQANGTYAASCFYCHGGVTPSELETRPADIKQFVTAGDTNSGHRIKTAGGTLPVGSPLPCYDCHNPHGSSRGNAWLISDELGADLGTSSASGTRRFCFSCHSSWDGRVWNSDTLSYEAVGIQTVEGLQRDGSDGSVLRLPSVTGHGWEDTGSCSDCHGKDYTGGGYNVHNPGPGASLGGLDCFTCHDYQSMQSPNSYHHYMASDVATPYPSIPDPGSLTASDSRRTCLVCHVDHDYFDPGINTDPAHTGGRAQNLRSSAGVQPNKSDGSTYVNRDHDQDDPVSGGVCVSCHRVQMTKNTANRKSSQDRFPQTLLVPPDTYYYSAHNYISATATFTTDGSTFDANCVKCHNDEYTKAFQTGPYEFGAHDSSLSALQTDGGQGGFAEDPQEQLCWLCHSRSFEVVGPYNPNGGIAYGSFGSDFYGTGLQMDEMWSSALNLKGLFTNAAIVSRHPIDGDGTTTARVECVNCHNVHKTEPDLGFSGDGVAQDPDNTLVGGGPASGGPSVYYTDPSADTQYATNRNYCLRCHDGATPTKVNDGTTYVPYDVFIPAASQANPNPSERPDKSKYVGRSHFNAVAADTSSTAQTIALQCSTCHDNHGSIYPSLIGVSNDVTGTPTISGSPVTGNNNTVCYACHTAGSGGVFTYDGTGYPTTGPWPGQATYDTAYNVGTNTGNGHLGAVWPGRTYVAGDCKNCHDVHGTANDYDQLRTEDPSGTEGVYGFSSDDLTLCFNCHDGSPAVANIKALYPGSVGGTSTGTRAGHRVLSDTSGLPGATLSQGDAVPCYDCHNPHGSSSPFMLQVRNIGDEVTDAFDLSDGPGVRKFCFACHLTSDTHTGWNGSAYATVTVGVDDTVEGIMRDSSSYKLLLPALADHTETNTSDCFNCHMDPHEPSGGVSAGGIECYTCHKAYQETMDADGTDRTSYYHHVLGTGGGTYSGDDTSTVGSYPGAGTDVYCMSCHVDHDTFNSSKASNLRADLSASSGAADTDFPAGGGGTGVCVGCHSVSLVKDVTNQKSSANGNSSDASTRTPAISGTDFPSSAHNYSVASTFDDATSFKANCSKCHNDEDIGGYKGFQTSENKFGPHFSAVRRILTAFGVTPSDPAGEWDCYGCHAPVGSFPDAKTTAGYDWYGTSGAAMTPLAEKVYLQFRWVGASSHPVESVGGNQVTCVNCHNTHVVSSADRVVDPENTYNTTAYGSAAEQAAFCLKCHDSTLPAYQVDGTAYVPQSVTVDPADAAAHDKTAYASRGHWSASGSISSIEVVPCASCHDNHGSNAPKLLGEFTWSDNSSRINNHVITANDNTVCVACHSTASSSFPAGEAQREAGTGYLMDGTWPGEAPYTSAYNATAHTGNGHLTASWPGTTYAAGDCKNCHNVHGTANTYDQLRSEDASGTYVYSDAEFTMCFKCHGADAGTPGFATSNIEQYYPVAAGGTGTGDNAGHQIKTVGGNLAVGDAMPCYNCHNPHGSRGQFMLQVRDIGDVAGEIDVSDDSGVREFCFTCHATSDTAVGWTGGAYSGVSTTTVEGLRRDGSDGSGLKLPSVTGHSSTDLQSCYQCHLNGPGNNPHNPAGGVSPGGLSCYTCHTGYQSYMEDDSGSATGANNATVYHHVLGGAAGEGDIAPNAGSYPTSTSDVYCVSCHTDHNYFNASNATNLRSDITNSSGSASADTDYSTNSNAGICTSCHATSLTKQGMGTEQKDDGSTATPKIVAGAGANQFGASAHNYTATSTFDDATTFKANCSKCHNDENDPAYKVFQTSANKFGTHWSAERRILSALGGTLTDPLSETHCYGCHTGGTAGNDYYGVQSMTQAARSTQAQFGLAYTHPVVATGGNSVECANCHNPHVVTAGTGKVTDPANTYNTVAYGTEAEKATFCLKCHSDALVPATTVNDTTYVPSTVTIAAGDQALMDKSTYGTRGHWSASGSIGSGEISSCGVCHAKHGSSYAKMLGAYDPATAANKINGAAITGNNTTVCFACHTSASSSFPSGTRDPVDGYPIDGTWPGSTVYSLSYDPVNSTGSMHNTTNAVWPGKAYLGGDCKNCHDVHGTANVRDELRTEDAVGTHGVNGYSASDFTFCFNCHDTDGPATRNIKTYYPSSVGGSAGGSGHEMKTAGGTLPVGGVLPCYNCHNPHGSASASYGLTIVSAIDGITNVLVGDAAGEILMSPANQAADPNNVRNFCFTCHTTADTTKGWDGSAMVVITAGAEVEGIDRTTSTVLHLPAQSGHNEGDTTQSCYGCHGNDYASLSGNNVHNPSGGISNGGSDCYTCHGTYQTYMEDGIGAKTGSSRATVYHHVMGSATNDGDKAFASGSYPTSSTDVYCLSCHVDHDKFNGSKSGNLRSGMSVETSAAVDYDSVGDSGVCTECHAASLTKQVGTDQKSDGSTATPKIVAGGGANQYGASAHDYYATSQFGDSTTFNANCSKCHNDENSPTYKDFQISTYRFGPHWSAERRILSALGGALTDPLSESHCYGCHTGVTAGNDYYGVQPMTQAARSTQAQFGLTSKHPVVAAGGNSVECANCHNPHVVDTSTGKVTDPANTYNTIAYSSDSERSAFCLKCHSSAALPSYTVNGTTYIPSTVTIAGGDQALMNKSTNAARGHWSQTGAIGPGEEVTCAECHDNHGSNAAKLLGVYDPVSATNKIGTTTISANDNTVCAGCHTSATGTTYTRLANGYPNIGTWPGTAIYDGANGIHKGSAVVWPGSTYAGGDCKNCHDVHGTSYTYDELVGQFDPASIGSDRYALCFNCHDGAPSTKNIKQHYPVADGGTSTAPNAGHQIKTAGGTLSAGQGLPCYDCHNPHGSAEPDGLMVETMINGTKYLLGDNGTEIGAISAAAGDAASVRLFCFTCHATAAGEGTNATGTGYTAAAGIKAGDLVEGLSRTGANKLKLSSTTAEHLVGATTANCFDCHGTMTADSATNVHNPSGGAGNDDCLVCHGVGSTERLDNMLPTATSSYHHVLDAANPDAWNTAYPTTTGTLECRSCHVDHANFNTAAGNLRGSYNDSPSGAFGKNTDYQGGAGGYSICMSCHSTGSLTKNTGQASLGAGTGASAATPQLNDAGYDASAHDYQINDAAKVGYGTGRPFLANCIKCHDDGSPSGRQKGTFTLAPHYSADNRIAQALGASLAGASTSSEENLCYVCHSGGGTADGYGVGTMTARTTGIQTQFAKTSKHNVAGYSGIHKADEYTAAPSSVNGQSPTGSGWWGTSNASKHVECEDCHNPHEAQDSSYVFPNDNTALRGNTTGVPVSGANKGVWGVDISGSASGKWTGTGSIGAPTAPTYNKTASVTYEWQLCLKCHSAYAWGNNTPPNVPSGSIKGNNPVTSPDGGGNIAGPMTDVGKDFNPQHYAYHPLFASGRNQPSNPTIYDRKGLPAGLYDSVWDTSNARRNVNGTSTGLRLTNTFVDGWTSTSLVTCSDCHNNDDDLASTGSHGPHGSANRWLLRGINTGIKVTTVSGVVYPNNVGYTPAEEEQIRNFCVNCHRRDVYGDGDRGLTITGAGTADIFSRLDHDGGMNSSCDAGDKLYNVPTGCYNCHGGRGNDGATASGLLHGTSMTRGDGDNTGGLVQNGTLVGDNMGTRFMNGASWDAHLLTDAYANGGDAGCSTIDVADSYSSCTQHSTVWGQGSAMNYYNP